MSDDCSSSATIQITATNPGGGGCLTGLCGGGTPNLTGTLSGQTGCFVGFSPTLTFVCSNLPPATAGNHCYQSTNPYGPCGASSSYGYITAPAGSPVVELPGGFFATVRAGYSCSPVALVADYDDGAGNAITITVS